MCFLLRRRDEILQNLKREPSVEDAIAYFDSMATYVDELRKLQRELRHMIRYVHRYNPDRMKNVQHGPVEFQTSRTYIRYLDLDSVYLPYGNSEINPSILHDL